MDSMDQGGIKWGGRIPVDGVRPDWLKDTDIIRAWSKSGKEWLPWRTANHNGWKDTGFVAMYANHPHYQKQASQPEAPAIDPALVERMVALVRDVAKFSFLNGHEKWEEARDILKALEPVDEDAEEAKRVVAEDKWGNAYDLALAAIRRGRQLEQETNA